MKAIETKYKGYKFRSRLEARWAVFFDEIGVAWEYEPEGYRLSNGDLYLPDFLLRMPNGRKYFFEVKGATGEDIFCLNFEGSEKVAQFALDLHNEENGASVVVAGNIPNVGYYEPYNPGPDKDEFYIFPFQVVVYESYFVGEDSDAAGDGKVYLDPFFFDVRDCCDSLRGAFRFNEYCYSISLKQETKCQNCGSKRWRHSWPKTAADAARSARFEHGQNGA